MRLSRLPVGSSAKIIVGVDASARATATRSLLPAGELAGPVLEAVGEADGLDHGADPLLVGLGLPASDIGSVMFSRALSVGSRLKAWNTEADALGRTLVRSRSDSAPSSMSPRKTWPSVSVSRPARRVHQRALAGARGAHDGRQATGGDADGDAVEGRHLRVALAVDLDRIGGAGRAAPAPPTAGRASARWGGGSDRFHASTLTIARRRDDGARRGLLVLGCPYLHPTSHPSVSLHPSASCGEARHEKHSDGQSGGPGQSGGRPPANSSGAVRHRGLQGPDRPAALGRPRPRCLRRRPARPRHAARLEYMHDVEHHTVCYLRDLLATPAHQDPEITTFLGFWTYEEYWHGEAIGAALAAHGGGRALIVAASAAELGLRDRLRPWCPARLGGRRRRLLALHMTWGAINEWTTRRLTSASPSAPGYRCSPSSPGASPARRAGTSTSTPPRPTVAWPATGSPSVVRRAVQRFWRPVGSGLMPVRRRPSVPDRPPLRRS